MFMFKKSLDIPSNADALPGRPNPIRTAATHFVNGNPLKGPYPAGFETAFSNSWFHSVEVCTLHCLVEPHNYETTACNNFRVQGWQSPLPARDCQRANDFFERTIDLVKSFVC